MDRYEVMAGKMTPLTDGAHRKWGFAGKVETRSYERLVDALIDFVETGDGLKARFLTGFAACLAADRKSVENRGFGVAVRKVRCHLGEDGTVRVSSVETMHERRYTVDDWQLVRRIASRLRTVYETVRDVGIQVGKHPSSISHALSDGSTCAGYHWQYLDE